MAAFVTPHVLQCIEPIWQSKPETAGRLRGRIEQITDFAKAKGLRMGENPARWKGHLDQVLPPRGKVAPIVHHAAMPYQNVPHFYARLMQHDGIGPIALRFLILSCARTNETLGARDDEFDLDHRALWIVPSERMKSGREWRVPLTCQAIDLVKLAKDAAKAQRTEREERLIFVNRKGCRLSNMALLQLMRRMGVNAVPHGFRSSFRDWCAETQNFGNEIVEMALAHAVGSKVELAYRRTDMVEKRRELAQAWADFVASGIKLKRIAA